MAVSYSQSDQRVCPKCGASVHSEIWSILHRLERPALWARCRDGTIHHVVCQAGHRGTIRASLLLFDPRLDFLVFSPTPLVEEQLARNEGSHLLELLRKNVGPAAESKIPVHVEVVPRDLLGLALGDPRLNVDDFAPGAVKDDELITTYRILKEGDFDHLLELIEGGQLPAALSAALRFEAGMALNRRGRISAKNCDDAIGYLHGSLDFYSRELFPHRWASVHSELATAFRYRAGVDTVANLREVVRCAEAALEVFDIEEYPEDYAITQSQRGNALVELKNVVTGALDQSIEASRETLRVFNRESYPDSWAREASNLATILIERGSEDDLRGAAKVLEEIVQSVAGTISSQTLALAQMHLGLVLSRLSDRKEEAIAILRAAYIELRHGTPREILISTFNLGQRLALRANPEDIPEAAHLLEQALALMSEQGSPGEHEQCSEQLAQVYLSWAHAAPDLHPEICARALQAFEKELDLEAVGVAFHELARLLGESADKGGIDLAISAAKRALSILRFKSQTESRAKALFNLGWLYFQQGARSPALSCCHSAMHIFRKLEPTPDHIEAIGEIQLLIARAEGESRRTEARG